MDLRGRISPLPMHASLKMDDHVTWGASMTRTDDGVEWQLAEQPVVTGRQILWEDGSEVEYDRIERPQLYLENGKPTVLFAAVKPKKDEDDSYNIHIALS